jgi:hypothetical protein
MSDDPNYWYAELRTVHAGPPPPDCRICARILAGHPQPADPPWPRFSLLRKARK